MKVERGHELVHTFEALASETDKRRSALTKRARGGGRVLCWGHKKILTKQRKRTIGSRIEEERVEEKRRVALKSESAFHGKYLGKERLESVWIARVVDNVDNLVRVP